MPSGDEYSAVYVLCSFYGHAAFYRRDRAGDAVNGVNMLLYLVFVPGFIFLAGYRVSMALIDIRIGADDGV